jgi:hypothetical protein
MDRYTFPTWPVRRSTKFFWSITAGDSERGKELNETTYEQWTEESNLN